MGALIIMNNLKNKLDIELEEDVTIGKEIDDETAQKLNGIINSFRKKEDKK